MSEVIPAILDLINVHDKLPSFVSWFSILILAIFVFPIPYLFWKLVQDFIWYIILGESSTGDLILRLINATKSDIRSRLFYLLWILKIYILTLVILILDMIYTTFNAWGYDEYKPSRILWLVCLFTFAIFWPLLVILTRPFRDNLLNFQVIINQFTQSIMFFVIGINVIYSYESPFPLRIYYNDLMITAFALCFSSIGTFLAILFKIGSHVKNLVLTIFPYFKFYCLRSIRKLRKFLNWICTINWKERRRLRKRRKLRKKLQASSKNSDTLMQTSTSNQRLETNNSMSQSSGQLEFTYKPKLNLPQTKINSSIAISRSNESCLDDY